MGEGGDGLHLDGVHLLEGVVQDTGCVDDLPSEVLVVHVSDEERLGGEGVLGGGENEKRSEPLRVSQTNSKTEG